MPLRRVLGIAAIAAAIVTVLTLWHGYLIWALVDRPGWPQPWASLLRGTVRAGGVSLVLVPVAERVLHPPWSRWIGWPGSLWMGFGFIVLVMLAVSEPVLAWGPWGDTMGPARWRAAVVGVVGVVLVLVGMRVAFDPQIRRVEVVLDRWPAALSGLRIVQISDIHIGPLLGKSFAAHLVREVNRQNPDLVAITGDLVDGSVAQLGDEVEPFAQLQARYGAYFVTGNHDFYSRADPWCARVSELGITVLRNRWCRVEAEGQSFALAGVDDYHGDPFGPGATDVGAAIDSIPEDLSVVLLAHDPTTFVEASRRGVDLQLSGHTHGGQIWPFGFAVRVAIPFVAGMFRRGRSVLYVSRGTGFWGPPMRLGARPEITVLTIISRGVPGAVGP